MMNTKRLIAALLVGALTVSALLTGCGMKNDTEKDQTPIKVVEGTTGESGQEVTTGASLPLTEEKQTLRIWMNNDVTTLDACGGDLNNSPFFQELEKRTNVHIEWIVPAAGTAQEQFNLLIGSGKLPDIMYTYSEMATYPDGLDAAVDDGYFLDLTDLLPKYAPNYLSVVNACAEDVQKGVKTDEGRYVSMRTISKKAVTRTSSSPYYGYMMRKDWLDKLGLEVPETFEEWENVLTRFKNELGATAPMCLNQLYFWDLGVGLGVYNPTDFYQIDGKVRNAFHDDKEAVREYFTIMNDWYEKGLIDPDFASAAPAAFWGDTVLISNNKTGAFVSMSMLVNSVLMPTLEEGASLVAVRTPVKNAGDRLQYTAPAALVQQGYVVTTDCENPELAVRWIDYLFSEEGAMLANYGIEGDTYNLDADGNPIFTDKILNNPDGMNYDKASRYFLLSPAFPASLFDSNRNLQSMSQEAKDMEDVWGDVDCDIAYPLYAALSIEESKEYSNLWADISTYIYENAFAFISGAKSLDEFDAFIDALESMGLGRCVEIKQAALDRFNSR